MSLETKKTKILHITTDLSIGGISSYIFSSLTQLKKSGVEVFCASSGGELVTQLEKQGVQHFNITIQTKNELHPKLIAAYLQLIDIIREKDITHIHAHTRVSQILAHWIKKAMNVTYIATCHSFYKRKILRRFFPAWGDRTIAISEAVREHLVNTFHVPKFQVDVIPNGIDITQYNQNLTDKDKQALKEYYGISTARFLIGSTSRLVDSKGYQYLIQAMPKIIEKYPKTKCILAGAGKHEKKLKKLAKQLMVDRDVIFTGNVSHVRQLLDVFDVYVLPAVQAEGFGLAVLEAMAMSKPVIVTDTGGLYELVKEGENGFLVQKKSPDALYRAISKLISDPQLIEKMGERSFEIASCSYAIEKVIDKVVLLYQELGVEIKK